MLNRLEAFIDEIKKSSSDTIIFNDGVAYSIQVPILSIFEAKVDYSNDKKSKEFFKDKTFYVSVNKMKEFVDNYKKSSTEITFDGNTIIFNTSIPGISLKFEWNENYEKILKSTVDHFNRLDEITSNQDYVGYQLYDKNDIPSLLESDEIEVDGEIMKIQIKKYTGRIIKTTKKVEIYVYNSGRKHTLYTKINIYNSNLVSSFYGCFISYS